AEEALKRAAQERAPQSSVRPPEPIVVTRPSAGAMRPSSTAPAFGPLQQDTTFQGATTLRYFGVTDIAQCQDACAAQAQCVAYTFVKRAAYASNPNNAVCYLSSSIGSRVTHPCCISATRAGLEKPAPIVSVPPHRVVQTISQAESRDDNGKITVEASTIHVTECDGGGSDRRMVYIYEYVNRRGLRAARPPRRGTPPCGAR